VDGTANECSAADSRTSESSWDEQVLSWIAHVQEADTLSAMAERLTDVLPWRVGVLYRAHQREGLLRPIWSKGCASVIPEDLTFALQPPDSLVAHCCVTRTPIVLISEAEYASWPLHQTARRIHADLGLRVVGAVPLLHADTPVGALFVGGDQAGIETDGQWRAIEALGTVIAGLIYRQMLLERVERQNRLLIATRELAEKTVFTADEASLWATFRDFLCTECGIDGGTYAIFDEGRWCLQEAFGVLRPYVDRLRVDVPLWLDARAASIVGSETRLLWTPEGVRALPPYVEAQSPLGQGLMYVIPNQDAPLAAVTLYANELDFAAQHVVPSVLHTLAMSMRLVRQRTRLAYLSEHDGLTGLLNRAGFERAMEAACLAAPARAAVFAILDLDHFKQINDTYGHQRGDACLIELARYLRLRLSSRDMIGRLGGDEFVILRFDATCDEAALAEWERIAAESPLGPLGSGMTVGLVHLPAEARDFGSCYRLADERLYLGKRFKQGRVVGCGTPV